MTTPNSPQLAACWAGLSQRLRPHQLLAVLRASVCPMIQLNAVSGLLESPIAGKKLDLPNNQHKREKLLMIPDPMAKSLRDDKINSPTCLLVVVWAFKITNRFGSVTAQRKMLDIYSVHAKQLVGPACITSKNNWVTLTGNEELQEVMRVHHP